MRIDAFNKISELYKTNSVKNTSKVKSSSFSDTLEISQAGKDYQTAKQVVARTPDIRETKVNEIKERMEAGTYNVTVEEVADKIVDHYFDQMD
jgi:negative regulator of flagellin synthesis FlgM